MISNKTFAAASLLLLGSMATFMLSSQHQDLSPVLFSRQMQGFKGDHGDHTDHGDHGHDGGDVAEVEELEIWEGDWYGPYNHAEGEWRVFWIPMKGNECCCNTWSDFAGTDTDLFLTDDPNYVLDPNWAGWDRKATEAGSKETATIRKSSSDWKCYAAVYGVVDTNRAGIKCIDVTMGGREDMGSPDWAL